MTITIEQIKRDMFNVHCQTKAMIISTCTEAEIMSSDHLIAALEE